MESSSQMIVFRTVGIASHTDPVISQLHPQSNVLQEEEEDKAAADVEVKADMSWHLHPAGGMDMDMVEAFTLVRNRVGTTQRECTLSTSIRCRILPLADFGTALSIKVTHTSLKVFEWHHPLFDKILPIIFCYIILIHKHEEPQPNPRLAMESPLHR